MRKFLLSEKNLVVILFVMVFVIFSFAHEDTKKIEKMQPDSNSSATTSLNRAETPGYSIKATDAKEITTPAELR